MPNPKEQPAPFSFLNQGVETSPQAPTLDETLAATLQQYAETLGLTFRHWEEKRTHYFQLGDTTVSLQKRLLNGTVGEMNGIVRSVVQQAEYDQVPWWKMVIDESTAEFIVE